MAGALWRYLLPVMLLLSGTACDMEKDIDLKLPPHTPQLVVECYLQPGQPYRLTLTESSSYLDQPGQPQVPKAVVVIIYQGKADTLRYEPMIDEVQRKLYTHVSPTLVSGKPGDVYTLQITDSLGRQVAGTTTLLAPVPIDSLHYRFNDRQEAYIEARFRDPADTEDFYFFSVHRDSTNQRAAVNYHVPDKLSNGKPFTLGTTFEFEAYDSLIVSLFHLEKQYYEFLGSVDDARNANGNPFAQPSRLRSTVQGGLGVFTNLAVDRKSTLIRP